MTSGETIAWNLSIIQLSQTQNSYAQELLSGGHSSPQNANPGYALLNILGLTIGIASALLIVLYLNQETSYDKYHPNADNIYRISSDITEPDNAFRWAVTQPPLWKNGQ